MNSSLDRKSTSRNMQAAVFAVPLCKDKNAENSCKLKQRKIWKHVTKLMTRHYKQAARETISCI